MANEDIAKLKIDKSAASIRPRRRGKLFRWLGAALVIAVAGFLYFTGVLAPAVQVEVATVSSVYPSQTFTLLNASGYVVAQRKASVSSKITGRLISLMAEEGSRVKKGAVIARLEGEDMVAVRDQAAANLNVTRFNLEQAGAELLDATRSLTRSKELVDKGYIARADFDVAEARQKKALAAVAGAEAAIKANAAALWNAEIQMDNTLLRAPFDAVVLTKNADVGDIVTPLGSAVNAQASVFTIADMSSLMAEVDVSEANIERIKVGQPCEVVLDALPESRFRGVVHMVVPTANRSKATVLVKVRFLNPDSRILPEMSARVAFLSREVRTGEQKPRLALNPAAVINRQGKDTVFVIRDSHAVEIPVQLGERIGEVREVIAGLKAGDKIAVKPVDKLKNGIRIKIAEQ